MHTQIRERLKQNQVVYALNARFKATLTSRAAARLTRQYCQKASDLGVTYSEQSATEQLRLRLAERGIQPQSEPSGKLRIFWVGANWNQDNSGFLASLGHFGETISFSNARGGYGLLYSLDGNGYPMPSNPEVIRMNDKCLLDQIEAASKDGPIHLLLGQMWADYISAEALKRVQRLGIITANVSMDDRLPEAWGYRRGVRIGSVGLCPGLDLVLTSSSDCCIRYELEGCPSLFWPMASDPSIFKPAPESAKVYDISFIGNRYGLRAKIIDGLRKAGIRVEAFGSGWPNGPADASASAQIFAKSRIILGVGNIAYNDDIYTLKLRDFDATMAGALYITHRNPDLLRLFSEGEEIECYSTIDECATKIADYLSHPAERMAVAAAGALKARRCHSWDIRISNLMRTLGFQPPQLRADSPIG